jgi:hypothetical protein
VPRYDARQKIIREGGFLDGENGKNERADRPESPRVGERATGLGEPIRIDPAEQPGML